MRRCRAKLDDCGPSPTRSAVRVAVRFGRWGEERRRGVGEREKKNCRCDGSHIGEAFPTAQLIALVWFLFGMGPVVYGQGAALNKALRTERPFAGIGPLVGMNAGMTLKV